MPSASVNPQSHFYLASCGFLFSALNMIASSFDITYRKHLCVAHFYKRFEETGVALPQSIANSSKLNRGCLHWFLNGHTRSSFPQCENCSWALFSWASIPFSQMLSFSPSIFTYLFLLPTYAVPIISVCLWKLTALLFLLLCRELYFPLAYWSSFWIISQSLLFDNQMALRGMLLSTRHFLVKINFINSF